MSKREFPEWPMVGVGGVVIEQNRALLVRRAREPALGEWTIPGGLLEVGETLAAGVAREIREETGLIVRVVELIEALERIFSESGEIRSSLEPADASADAQEAARFARRAHSPALSLRDSRLFVRARFRGARDQRGDQRSGLCPRGGARELSAYARRDASPTQGFCDGPRAKACVIGIRFPTFPVPRESEIPCDPDSARKRAGLRQ